jgi:hypothetical protein
MHMVLRPARMATIPTHPMVALPMATTARTGSRAGCSSEPARGSTAITRLASTAGRDSMDAEASGADLWAVAGSLAAVADSLEAVVGSWHTVQLAASVVERPVGFMEAAGSMVEADSTVEAAALMAADTDKF